MADNEFGADGEFAGIRKLNEDLQHRYLETLLSEQCDRCRILYKFQDEIVKKLIEMLLIMESLPKNSIMEQDLVELKGCIYSMANSAHLLAGDIAPHTLLEMGLAASLHELLRGYKKDQNFSYCIDSYDCNEDNIDTNTKLILYRLIKDLLHEIIYTYHANTLIIVMRFSSTEVEFLIEDNGGYIDLAEIISTGLYIERSHVLELTETLRLLGGIIRLTKSQDMNSTCISFPIRIQL